METVERFRKAYDYLYESGAIHTKKDLAEKMKVSRGSVQYAYAGNESYLNESFLKKFAKTFEAINLDWLLTGEGEVTGKRWTTLPKSRCRKYSSFNLSQDHSLIRHATCSCSRCGLVWHTQTRRISI